MRSLSRLKQSLRKFHTKRQEEETMSNNVGPLILSDETNANVFRWRDFTNLATLLRNNTGFSATLHQTRKLLLSFSKEKENTAKYQ